MKKYQIGPVPPQVDPALIEGFGKVEIATIGHFRHRGFLRGDLRPLAPLPGLIAGTAITVAIPGTDSTMLHHAMSVVRPGDVVVIDRLGDTRHACLGGGVAYAAKMAGAVAVVLDGPCTDPDEIVAAMKGIAPNREDLDAKRPAPAKSSVPITARPADPEPA